MRLQKGKKNFLKYSEFSSEEELAAPRVPWNLVCLGRQPSSRNRVTVGYPLVQGVLQQLCKLEGIKSPPQLPLAPRHVSAVCWEFGDVGERNEAEWILAKCFRRKIDPYTFSWPTALLLHSFGQNKSQSWSRKVFSIIMRSTPVMLKRSWVQGGVKTSIYYTCHFQYFSFPSFLL